MVEHFAFVKHFVEKKYIYIVYILYLLNPFMTQAVII